MVEGEGEKEAAVARGRGMEAAAAAEEGGEAAGATALGLKSAKDLSFGRREGFLARYERANALPPRPRVGRARVCPFFPVAAALAAVAPPKGRQLGAKCPHEGRRRVRTPSFSQTRPPKGDLCGTWSVHA